MTERVVVCFRSPELFVEADVYLAAARALGERAAARGGRLISWGATVYAFEFETDALQDAIEFALSVVRDAGAGKEHGIGISEGPLEQAEEPTAKIKLTWGYPLVRAAAFARAARPGEVLVDPLLGAAKRGELLTVGSRVGVYGKLRLRGLLLDVKHPWRTALAESARGLVRPELIGRAELSGLALSPGTIGIVRAPRGAGGSRVLEELEQEWEPARTLHVTPHPFGEPLGALRRAMLRAVTLGQAPLNLTGQAGHSLDALLAGEGLDPDSSAELLTAWLTPDSPSDPSGVIALDDATEIDSDTLEVVGRALASGGEPFRVLARLAETDPLPRSLAAIPVGTQIPLEALPLEQATALALACTRGELDEKAAARWATRGGRLPLGIVESIREAIEAGEIVWEDGRALARLRSSGTGGARPPKHWVKRRLEHVDDEGRCVLGALAALGGQAESRELGDVLRRRVEVRVDVDATLAVLEAGGWVRRGKPDLLTLPSATHRDAVLASLTDQEFHAWHRAAAEATAARDRPLSAASATAHAVLAGDAEYARELARLAAAATRAMGLELTAEAFERFGEKGDLGRLTERNLFASQLDLARAVPSVWPDARSSAPPGSQGPGASDSLLPPSSLGAGESIPPSTESAVEIFEPDGPTLSRGLDRPSAVDALRHGDPAVVERVAEQLRGLDKRHGLADRLHAMAKLARGETGDAIRRLRDAAEVARQTGSRDRCRASLALGVALAAANRHDEALLEALDALARAREMTDAKGERACLKFLAQLAATVGHHDVAEAWAAAAEG